MIEKLNNIGYNKRAMESIAHGALTNSKRAASFVDGVYPTHMESGYKCYITDADHIHYIDYICGLGTNLFGYGNPEVRRAVTKALQKGGPVYSLGSIEEVQYAERLKGIFPFLDRVRFLKSGSEGCSAAIRIARAYHAERKTGRGFVLAEGYHGWHDEFVSLTPPAKGVPNRDSIHPLKGNEELISHCAAVIMEPIGTDISADRVKYLNKIRKLCTDHGTVLIFDETITAYRFPKMSVAQFYNITPDLWIGGKALGAGLSISVVGGKREIMESDYFVSSTWAGDRLSFAAGGVAIKHLHNEFKPDELWVFGQEFLDKFNALSPDVQIVGYPTRGVFKYSSELFKHLFMQEMCLCGVLIGPSWFYNKHLHAEMHNVLSIAKSIIKNIYDDKVPKRGKSPKSPFAVKVRENNASTK